MSAARDWMQRSTHPLDFHYIPSTMGGAFSLGLGIALAQPQREVIVLNGDGCLLMNLGSLITSAVSGATNFTGIIIDNGNYETTGGQQLATTGSTIANATAPTGWTTLQSRVERNCRLSGSIIRPVRHHRPVQRIPVPGVNEEVAVT